MAMSEEAAARARHIQSEAESKLERLRTIDPYLIDSSLRENVFGSRLGQTLPEKLEIFRSLRAFGFKNILLGSLDYFMPDEPEVDDDFMRYLQEHHVDRSGCFAFTDVGLVSDDGSFRPSASQHKLQAYGVPNTLHEIYLSREGMQGQYDAPTLRRSLPRSITWLCEHVRGDHGARPRILINIVDGCDAFAENPQWVGEVLGLLAEQPIEGVSFEDDRGTFLPFQIGAFTALARASLPPPLKLLVHVHSGAGFENASVIEALLNGADGAWGGLPKRAALIGHASLGELIANLARVNNPHVTAFQLQDLLPLVTRLQTVDERAPVPDELPIFGRNAYRLTLGSFAQKARRFMDLPPETIGGKYGYRVCPLAADEAILAGRLAEITGRPAETFLKDVLTQMVRLMRRELRAGERVVYDDPEQLQSLYTRAGGNHHVGG